MPLNELSLSYARNCPQSNLTSESEACSRLLYHANREFVEFGALNKINDSILVRSDMKKSFNMIIKDHILEICERRDPSLLSLASLAYSSMNDLVFEDNLVQTPTGVQQGDPLGPVLFDRVVDDIARSVKSPVNIWYLDDATIDGPATYRLVTCYPCSFSYRIGGLPVTCYPCSFNYRIGGQPVTCYPCSFSYRIGGQPVQVKKY